MKIKGIESEFLHIIDHNYLITLAREAIGKKYDTRYNKFFLSNAAILEHMRDWFGKKIIPLWAGTI